MSYRFPLALALALIFVTHALAQAPTYSRTPGETLRYRITTESESTSFTETSAFDRMFDRELTVAVTFTPSDTVEAVVEAFTLESGDPRSPESYDMLADTEGHHRFILAADSMGQMIEHPTMTRSQPVMGGHIGDQFNYFFPHLPSEPLAPGVSWTWNRNIAQDKGGTRTDDLTYTAVEESTREGYTVIVIEMEGTSVTKGLFETSTGNEVDMDTQDTHTGTYYFAVDEGRIVGFERTTKTKSYSEIKMAGRTMTSDREATTTTKARLLER
ncbi:MAG: hypothetical protein RhofKO_24570 [Rhodothermales bacterium]